MTFGAAIEAACGGKKIARAGWNGADQWVVYMPAMTIPAGMVNDRTRRFVASGDINVGAYFVMWTSAGVWQPGWLASQADMFAEDWVVVE